MTEMSNDASFKKYIENQSVQITKQKKTINYCNISIEIVSNHFQTSNTSKIFTRFYTILKK